MRLVIFENILTFRRPAWYTHTEVKIPYEHLFCSIWFSLEVLRIQWLEKVSSSGKIFKQKFHKIFIKSHDLVFPNFHTKESKKKRIQQLSSNQGNQKPMARTSKIFKKTFDYTKRKAILQSSGRNKPTRLFSYAARNRNDRRWRPNDLEVVSDSGIDQWAILAGAM